MPLTYLQKSTKLLLKNFRVFSTLKKNDYKIEDEKWFAKQLSSYENFNINKEKNKNYWFIP